MNEPNERKPRTAEELAKLIERMRAKWAEVVVDHPETAELLDEAYWELYFTMLGAVRAEAKAAKTMDRLTDQLDAIREVLPTDSPCLHPEITGMSIQDDIHDLLKERDTLRRQNEELQQSLAATREQLEIIRNLNQSNVLAYEDRAREIARLTELHRATDSLLRAAAIDRDEQKARADALQEEARHLMHRVAKGEGSKARAEKGGAL